MWSETEWGGSENHGEWPEEGLVDFWDTDRPAAHLNGTGYEEDLFRARMLEILAAHDKATPLLINYALPHSGIPPPLIVVLPLPCRRRRSSSTTPSLIVVYPLPS